PYPANGCVADPKCRTDAQLQAELSSYVKSHCLPQDLTHEYFILTPPGVEDCFEATGLECSAGSTNPVYCAYHDYNEAAGRPTVTKVTPKTGPTTGATTVTIMGTNLTGATAVDFGATPAAKFTVTSSTSITATSPAHAAGLVDVTVTTAGGTSAISLKDHYKFTPLVASVSPTGGPGAGGTTVTVNGSGFAPGAPATKVKFRA